MDPSEPIMSVRDIVLDLPWKLSLRGGAGRHRRVMDGVSLDMRPGEVVAILGHNGAGKSTLMRILGGVYKPTGGEVTMPRGGQAALLSLNMGFQKALTGRENAKLVGLLMGVGRTGIRDALEAMPARSGLGGHFDMPMFTYSVGMQARLAFAASRMGNPEVLLVDEVLSVGDADFRADCRRDLAAMADAGGAVAIVSHDMATVREMATRAVVLDRGRVGFDGSVEDGIAVYETAGRAAA